MECDGDSGTVAMGLKAAKGARPVGNLSFPTVSDATTMATIWVLVFFPSLKKGL
jgi:hypothetical protein